MMRAVTIPYIRKSWPYAKDCPKDSVGDYRGVLYPGVLGDIRCWEAKGEARRFFDHGLKTSILNYLRKNTSRIHESDSFLSLTLFLVGKRPDQAKPVVMFVAGDKAARKEAFDLVKESGIMASYPGFELGHTDLGKVMALAGEVVPVFTDTIGSNNVKCFRLFSPQSSLQPAPVPNAQHVRAGEVLLQSKELDFALVKVDGDLDVQTILELERPVELDIMSHEVELSPRETAVTTITPDGKCISGSLSGSVHHIRLPLAREFTEVYVAKFSRPLSPGDCGSWVRNARNGKFFGHIIAGNTTDGHVVIMPAHVVLGHARPLVAKLGLASQLTSSNSLFTTFSPDPAHHVVRPTPWHPNTEGPEGKKGAPIMDGSDLLPGLPSMDDFNPFPGA